MTDTASAPDRPGEARTRQRRRRQVMFTLVAVLIGFGVGLATGWFDEGDGNLFNGDWEALTLPPWVALALALALALGLLALPLWGFTQLDDFKREINLVGYAGGCLAATAGFPIWAVLYAGGFAPLPHAFGVWLIAFGGLIAAYGYAWLRSR
ncbi:MAG: hypothetical protein V2I27_07460 [Erythrobacter sp.]|jgi:hypothetical protein|nr:hypothetical protein [Erythrobacter sp.]